MSHEKSTKYYLCRISGFDVQIRLCDPMGTFIPLWAFLEWMTSNCPFIHWWSTVIRELEVGVEYFMARIFTCFPCSSIQLTSLFFHKPLLLYIYIYIHINMCEYIYIYAMSSIMYSIYIIHNTTLGIWAVRHRGSMHTGSWSEYGDRVCLCVSVWCGLCVDEIAESRSQATNNLKSMFKARTLGLPWWSSGS